MLLCGAETDIQYKADLASELVSTLAKHGL